VAFFSFVQHAEDILPIESQLSSFFVADKAGKIRLKAQKT